MAARKIAVPAIISPLARRSSPTPVRTWKTTSATARVVPAVLSRCGGARSSRSHLRCHDMSQVEPSIFRPKASSQSRNTSRVVAGRWSSVGPEMAMRAQSVGGSVRIVTVSLVLGGARPADAIANDEDSASCTAHVDTRSRPRSLPDMSTMRPSRLAGRSDDRCNPPGRHRPDLAPMEDAVRSYRRMATVAVLGALAAAALSSCSFQPETAASVGSTTITEKQVDQAVASTGGRVGRAAVVQDMVIGTACKDFAAEKNVTFNPAEAAGELAQQGVPAGLYLDTLAA